MALYSRVVKGLSNGQEVFVKVFTRNPEGRINRRIDLPFASAIPSEFPAEPSNYSLISKYTSSFTFVAPEDGWYRFVLQGASGNGGAHAALSSYLCSGGGGGGGGCAIAVVKLKKGDTVEIVLGVEGNTSSCTFKSSVENRAVMQVTSGANGTQAYGTSITINGKGGIGGVASGGDENYNGGNGGDGLCVLGASYPARGTGGDAGYTGGNRGSDGGPYPTGGLPAFIEIYRGNTNIVA